MTETKTPMRGIRRTRILTIDDVALQTGINRGALSRIERGYLQPSTKVKEALAKFFDLPDFILFPPDEASREKRT